MLGMGIFGLESVLENLSFELLDLGFIFFSKLIEIADVLLLLEALLLQLFDLSIKTHTILFRLSALMGVVGFEVGEFGGYRGQRL